MTQHEFVMNLIDLETKVIRCSDIVDVSVLRTEIHSMKVNRNSYNEQDYIRIVSNLYRKLKRMIGEKAYTSMFVIKLPNLAKKY